MMESTSNVHDDLAYVQRALSKHSFGQSEYRITLVWAFVNLIGFSLYDVHMLAGGVFWMIALPVFGIGTGWWFERQKHDEGEIDKTQGVLHAWHWTTIPIFLFFANTLFLSQGFSMPLAGQIVLLIVGLVYYMGGVHFWWGYKWAGVAIASGMLWLVLLDRFAWTLTGVLTFIVLAGVATVDRRRHAT